MSRMLKEYDLAIVGGGILGTFHAFHALKRGLTVALFEKNKQAQGASVRNFGQVVPSGMNLKWQRIGRRSLEIYKGLQKELDLSIREQGSVYIASNEEEMTLIEELAVINQNEAYGSRLMSPKECLKKYEGLKANYCKGALYFPQEINVDPRVLVHRIQGYLQEQLNLNLFYSHKIKQIESYKEGVKLEDSFGQTVYADKAIVCNGTDFQTLFPRLFAESDLVGVKLQMLETQAVIHQKLPGSILTGLSIRRYESFSECPSYATIKTKENPESLEKKYGVHILFKQSADGSVIIGDSHEYADAKNIDDLGFDLSEDINVFMLNKAREIFKMDDWKIAKSWYGLYSQCKHSDVFVHHLEDRIHIITGIGGKGMTASPGFAENNLKRIYND